MRLFAILTLFPEALEAYTRTSILGRAQERGLTEIRLLDIRDFTRDRHRTVDDRPFGGGPGMVLKPEPVVECVEWCENRWGPFRKFLLSPGGETFRQSTAERLVDEERLLFLCGRYEGVDERIRSVLDFEELSVGDFVLSGGELGALLVTEAIVRLVPGALGDARSAEEDSFTDGGGLDFPAFTRPRVFRGHAVPEVLMSGNHEEIERWRRSAALSRTRELRPDLIEKPERSDLGPAGRGEETDAPKPEPHGPTD